MDSLPNKMYCRSEHGSGGRLQSPGESCHLLILLGTQAKSIKPENYIAKTSKMYYSRKNKIDTMHKKAIYPMGVKLCESRSVVSDYLRPHTVHGIL